MDDLEREFWLYQSLACQFSIDCGCGQDLSECFVIVRDHKAGSYQ